MNISSATKARIAARHLSRERYEVLTREDGVYLCERGTTLNKVGDMTAVIHTKRMVCKFEDDDNVFALRHTRAVRNWQKLKEQWDERIAEPRRQREQAYEEEAQAFREKFTNASVNNGWFGKQSWSGFGIKPI